MGRGLHLTIDEWFYYHLADEQKLQSTAKLFVTILEVCDKIVIKRGTPLAKKFHELVEDSIMYPPVQRKAVQTLLRCFLQNSHKVYWIEEDVSLEPEIEKQLPWHDVYLVKMCLQTKDKIFVTTDAKLFLSVKSLFNELGIFIYMANDFMENYPQIAQAKLS